MQASSGNSLKWVQQYVATIYLLFFVSLIYSNFLAFHFVVNLQIDIPSKLKEFNSFIGICLEMFGFHVILGLFLVSLYKACITDAGFIPDDPRWDYPHTQIIPPEDDPRRRMFEIGPRGDIPRVCQVEMKYIPDRAHFCSVLNKNVLRFDHYCPWTSNAVGLNNHKFFLLTLFYGNMALIWVLTGNSLTFHDLMSQEHATVGKTIMVWSGMFMSISILIVTLPYLFFHVYLMATNQTTIEYMKINKNKPPHWQNGPYNIGVLANICQLLGPSFHLWFIPINNSLSCQPESLRGINWSRKSELDPIIRQVTSDRIVANADELAETGGMGNVDMITSLARVFSDEKRHLKLDFYKYSAAPFLGVYGPHILSSNSSNPTKSNLNTSSNSSNHNHSSSLNISFLSSAAVANPYYKMGNKLRCLFVHYDEEVISEAEDEFPREISEVFAEETAEETVEETAEETAEETVEGLSSL